jgi:hypothetical protein
MPTTPLSLLTAQEALVIDSFKQRSVRCMDRLCSSLRLSRMTVFRALSKHGYFSSFNHNSRYYALCHTPRFDDNGLWFYRTIGFSRHHTLAETLVALVNASSTGQTPDELTRLLLTPVGNLLALLVRRGRLARRRLARQALYLAVQPQLQQQQWMLRQQVCTTDEGPSSFPAPLPPASTLPALVELIRCPTASIEQLTHTLGRSGLTIRPEQLRALFDFYQLEKKRHTTGRRTPCGIVRQGPRPLATTRGTAPERRLHL